MKLNIQIDEKDVVLLLGVAKGNGFKRSNPLAPYTIEDKQDALKFLFGKFIQDLKNKTYKMMAEELAKKSAKDKKNETGNDL